VAGLKTNDPAPDRLVSLDVFRGLTIAGMILVNNPGSWAHVFPPLRHAEWHGWTPTDLVFPFFLFIVGVALPYSLSKRSALVPTYARIVRRAVLLFLLGLLINAFPKFDLSTLRIPGVLQRIALVYLVAAPIVLHTRVKTQAILGALFLLFYWGLLTWVPVPGVGAGHLTPNANLGAYLDRKLFWGHLWSQSRTWDPEGLLGTIPAVSTALFGALAGHWLRSPRGGHEKAAGMFVFGCAGLLVGSLWHTVFPLNKNLWTSSYVVFTAGFALVVLASCYWLVDLRGRRKWAAPLVVFGVNPIAAYVLSSLAARALVWKPAGTAKISMKTWIWERIFEPLGPPLWASLAFAVAYVLVWWALMGILYRRRIYLKV